MYYLYMFDYHQIFLNFILLGTMSGIIMALVGEFLPDGNASSNTIFFGYLLSAFFMLFVFVVSWISVTYTEKKTTSQIIQNITKTSIPPFLILGQIIYIIIINSIYKDSLIKNKVAKEYYTYSYAFSFLLLMQVGIMIKLLSDLKSFNISNAGYMIYIFGTLGFILLGIMQTILQFFSTDG